MRLILPLARDLPFFLERTLRIVNLLMINKFQVILNSHKSM